MPNLQIKAIQDIPGLAEAIDENCLNPQNDFNKKAAIHLGILRNQWTKDEVKKHIQKLQEERNLHNGKFSRFLREYENLDKPVKPEQKG